MSSPESENLFDGNYTAQLEQRCDVITQHKVEIECANAEKSQGFVCSADVLWEAPSDDDPIKSITKFVTNFGNHFHVIMLILSPNIYKRKGTGEFFENKIKAGKANS